MPTFLSFEILFSCVRLQDFFFLLLSSLWSHCLLSLLSTFLICEHFMLIDLLLRIPELATLASVASSFLNPCEINFNDRWAHDIEFWSRSWLAKAWAVCVQVFGLGTCLTLSTEPSLSPKLCSKNLTLDKWTLYYGHAA